jgi:hypothetical protein
MSVIPASFPTDSSMKMPIRLLEQMDETESGIRRRFTALITDGVERPRIVRMGDYSFEQTTR